MNRAERRALAAQLRARGFTSTEILERLRQVQQAGVAAPQWPAFARRLSPDEARGGRPLCSGERSVAAKQHKVRRQ